MDKRKTRRRYVSKTLELFDKYKDIPFLSSYNMMDTYVIKVKACRNSNNSRATTSLNLPVKTHEQFTVAVFNEK